MECTEDLLCEDKLLFATDLVDYIIMRTRPSFGEKTVNILTRVDRIRNQTYNRFSKTIRKALNVIDINQDASVFEDFAKMMKKNCINSESFIKYASNYRESILSDGFHPKAFLMYCDHVANMAGYFLSKGVEDAADIAVESVMQAFPQRIMYHSDWSKITEVAESLEILGNDYYKGSMSSDSSCESIDQISKENEDNASDSVNMDVDISSPEDFSQTNSDSDPSIFKKELVKKYIKNSFTGTTDIGFEVMSAHSTDSACSLAFSSLSTVSNNNASPASPEERGISKHGS